jgi:hypothetical protein
VEVVEYNYWEKGVAKNDKILEKMPTHRRLATIRTPLVVALSQPAEANRSVNAAR